MQFYKEHEYVVEIMRKVALGKIIALSGNRTRAARVAGEHSTTEPPMLAAFKGSEQEGHPYSPVNLKSLHLCTVDYVAGQNSIRFLTPLHRPRRGGRVVKAMDC